VKEKGQGSPERASTSRRNDQHKEQGGIHKESAADLEKKKRGRPRTLSDEERATNRKVYYKRYYQEK
jgi:hypothetical protein